MNTSDFFRGGFLKVEDLNGEPLRATVTKVEEGKYGLVLTLDNEAQLSLNKTNGKTIQKAWGYESDAWIEKQVELRAGETKYKGEMVPSIILRTISPALSEAEREASEPDISDDIPF
jgi:hypothetical protein